MDGIKHIEDLKFNETVNTKQVLPGLEEIVGDTIKFVGKSYIFEGSNGVLQEIKLWAEGFDHEQYEPE